MKLRILSEADVRGLISMKEAIDLQARAFVLLARGESIEGLRSFAASEDPPGISIFNPSYLKQGAGFGIKVVSDFYNNERIGVARMTSLVALFDGRTGAPRTVMEGGHLTDLRTGAGTALTARYLARRDSRKIAIIGAGRVARNQLEALCTELPIKSVRVSTRTRSRGEQFVARMSAFGAPVPSDITLVEDPEEAVRDADIVVAATTAHKPVFPGSAVRPGAFVVGAGAHEATSREVDSEAIRKATKWVVDSRSDCLDHAGDLVIPIQEGIISRDQVAEIAELVDGRRKGRESPDEVTYFKSIGVPIQDLVTAQFIEAAAIKADAGVVIDIGGDDD